MAKLRPMRQARVNRLREAGFSYKEALDLTRLKQNGKPVIVLKRQHVKDMIRARKKGVIAGLEDKNTVERFRAVAEMSDTPESWAIFRYYHKQAIDSGAIDLTPRKYDPNKPHRKLNADGTIDREYEKQRRREDRQENPEKYRQWKQNEKARAR